MELILHTFTLQGEVPFSGDKFAQQGKPFKRDARRNYREFARELDGVSMMFCYSDMKGFERGGLYHGVMRTVNFLDCLIENFYKVHEHSLFMHRVRFLGDEDKTANAIITLEALCPMTRLFKYAHGSRRIDVRHDFDIREFTSIQNVLNNTPMERNPEDFY